MRRGRERVLILSTSYPATADDGSGHFVRSHALALERQGAEVHVVVPGVFSKDVAIEDGLLVHRVGGSSLFGWPGASVRVRQNPVLAAATIPFAQSVRARTNALGAFDRVVAHWMFPTAIPLLTFAEARGSGLRSAELEVIAHGADVRFLMALPKRLRSVFAESLSDRAARFTFVGQTLRHAFLSSLPKRLRGRIEDRSAVRPCPIVVPPRDALRDPRPSDERSEPYAVWVGRDAPAKRLDLAIAAARAARIKLVVVGASRPIRRDRSEDGVSFVGTRPRDEALAWIAHASLLLSTSCEEGAPTVAREARALGVRVVACDAGDLAHWSREDDGISLVAADVSTIALAIADGS